jgi:anaerobic selenocysteine-containing dehydrogenase
MAQAAAERVKEATTRKVRTQCAMCVNHCGVIATVEDGVVMRIDGDPDNPYSAGKACAKGRAGFFTLDSPHRVTRPLKRTNPEKGVGVDPGWVPISWDEALNVVAAKLKEVHEEDPKKLFFATFDFGSPVAWSFGMGFGTPVQAFSPDLFCGNAVHPFCLLNLFGMGAVPDMPLTRYVLAEGGQFTIGYRDAMHAASELGSNRDKVKVVAVDPFCTHAASMADEWIAIRPGTDAAFLLGLVNVLVNELGIYDAPFLKNLTNAPYLVGADGRYDRDPETGKPLIWDAANGAAKPFDAAIGDAALLGKFQVRGDLVSPAFQVLADQVKKYAPQEVSRITGIPAATVRRIAKEFGEAASIGSTITIDGKQLPYRPAAVVWYRGLSSHKHGYLNGMAATLLQTVIGALDVPGGLIGHQRYAYHATADGLLTITDPPGLSLPTNPYPPRPVTPPNSIDLFELFPVACYSRAFAIRGTTTPERYNHLSIQPKMLLQERSNMVFSGGGREVMSEFLRKIPFVVTINCELEETSDFADIVIPGLHYLEDLKPKREFASYTGSGSAVFFGQKPVVKPPFDPPWNEFQADGDILLELARRAGFVDDIHATLNAVWRLRPEYALAPGQHYSYRELMDRYLKSELGPDKGLDWYLEDGIVVKEVGLKERYPGAYPKPRVHLYHEYMIGAGRDVEAMTKKLNIAWETADYIPLPEWRPCPAHAPKSPEFDLYLITAKAPYHAFTPTSSNPILNEVGNRLGHDCLVLHRDAAKRKRLKDGDWVDVETDSGKKARGRVKLTAGIHPEVAVVWSASGRWARSATQGGAQTGIHFNSLLTMDDEHMDFVSAAVDSCLRIKITKVRQK